MVDFGGVGNPTSATKESKDGQDLNIPIVEGHRMAWWKCTLKPSGKESKEREQTKKQEEKAAFAQHVLMMVGSLVECMINRVSRYKIKEDWSILGGQEG